MPTTTTPGSVEIVVIGRLPAPVSIAVTTENHTNTRSPTAILVPTTPPRDTRTPVEQVDVAERIKEVDNHEELQELLKDLRENGAVIRDLKIKSDPDGSLDTFEFILDQPGRDNDFAVAYDMDTDLGMVWRYDGILSHGRDIMREHGMDGTLGGAVRFVESGGLAGLTPLPDDPDVVTPAPEPW